MELPVIQTSIRDLAINLSRLPRWCGATIVPWSVLQHSLAMYALAENDTIETKVAVLVHDTEEAMAGDTRRGFKVPEQEAFGEEIRKYLYAEVFKLPYPGDVVLARVKELDDLIAQAESDCLMPPAKRIASGAGSREWAAVWDLTDMTAREGVHCFVQLLTNLLDHPQMKVLRARL